MSKEYVSWTTQFSFIGGTSFDTGSNIKEVVKVDGEMKMRIVSTAERFGGIENKNWKP